MIRKLILLGFIAVMLVPLSACGTLEGAGRDLEKAGEAIQRSAN